MGFVMASLACSVVATISATVWGDPTPFKWAGVGWCYACTLCTIAQWLSNRQRMKDIDYIIEVRSEDRS